MLIPAICVALIMASAVAVPGQDGRAAQIQRSDALYQQYRKTETLDSLRQAIAILDGLGSDYETSWRQARDYYSLADDTKPHTEKLGLFQKAVDSGQRAVQLAPSRAEGHYWLGVAYGGYGETKGKLKAMTLISPIRKEMETVITIQPGYENAGAYLVLGKMDYELPGIMGGSTKRSIQEYEQGLKLAPSNALMKVYLAESYIDAGRKSDARALVEQVLKLDEADPSPEFRDAKREAKKVHDKYFSN